MPPLASAPRVVIAGAGPGGLAAASLLRDAGAIVTVVEKAIAGSVLPARRASVVVGREAWSTLAAVGGRELLEDADNVVSATEQMMSLRRIDAVLGPPADGKGATILRGMAVEGVEELVGGAAPVSVTIRDVQTGAIRNLEADWFIDAASGKSPLADDPRFARVLEKGPYDLLPSERGFMAVQAKAQPARGVGWTGPDSAYAINDRTEGIVTVYRPIATQGRATPKPSAAEGAALLRSLGVDEADAIGAPWTFTARQTLAPHAAAGRLLLVGDSVGTVLPVTQAGTMLAMTDAERAAKTIVAAHAASSADEALAIVRRYDDETRSMHRAFLR